MDWLNYHRGINLHIGEKIIKITWIKRHTNSTSLAVAGFLNLKFQ